MDSSCSGWLRAVAAGRNSGTGGRDLLRHDHPAPVRIPALGLARKLFGYSMVFFVPRKVRHPVQELGKSARSKGSEAVESVKDTNLDISPVRKRAGKMLRAGRSFLEHQRNRVD